jgi:hypothetical protein
MAAPITTLEMNLYTCIFFLISLFLFLFFFLFLFAQRGLLNGIGSVKLFIVSNPSPVFYRVIIVLFLIFLFLLFLFHLCQTPLCTFVLNFESTLLLPKQHLIALRFCIYLSWFFICVVAILFQKLNLIF